MEFCFFRYTHTHTHTHTHTQSVQSCLHTVGMQPGFKLATGCMWPLLTWLPCDILGAKTSQPAPGVSDLPEEVCLNSRAAFSAQPSLATAHVHARTAHPQNTPLCALEHPPPALVWTSCQGWTRGETQHPGVHSTDARDFLI